MNNYVTTHGNKMAPIAQSDHSPTTSTNSTSSMSSITTLDEKQQHQSSQAKQQQHPKEPTRNHSALSSSAISRQITNSTTSMSNAEFSTTSKRKCFISVWSTWWDFMHKIPISTLLIFTVLEIIDYELRILNRLLNLK